MNWRSHALIGAILAGCVFWLLAFGLHDPILSVLGMVFGALSALIPDLDHDSSKGRKLLDLGVIAFSLLIVYLGACGQMLCLPASSKIAPAATLALAMIGAYFVLFRFFKPKHRGITHTIVASLGFGILVYFVTGWVLAVAGFVGYLSHLIADRHIKVI